MCCPRLSAYTKGYIYIYTGNGSDAMSLCYENALAVTKFLILLL
jgi:hypothetical protein